MIGSSSIELVAQSTGLFLAKRREAQSIKGVTTKRSREFPTTNARDDQQNFWRTLKHFWRDSTTRWFILFVSVGGVLNLIQV